MQPLRQHLRHTLAVTFLGLAGILIFQLSELHEPPALAEVAPLPAVRTERRVALLPPVNELKPAAVASALQRRDELLARTVTVEFTDDAGKKVGDWKIVMADHPLWILFQRDAGGVVSIDRERIKQELISYPPESVPAPKQCTVLSAEPDPQGVTRVKTDCIAKSGYTYDVAAVAEIAATAVENGQETASAPLVSVAASVIDPINSPDKPLTLLSTGRSTFTGSGYGRKQNVRKAINEREHNVFVPTDGVFAFNDTLGKVTVGNGWQMALTIFEGVNLRPAPGGGICQASTTVYRAALNAGLPILEQKSHSLYVTYYEAHGVGLDATVFPGLQDFKFKNDTGGPVIIQAYTEGDEVTVNMFGYDDNRTVTLTGPYFAGTAPEDLTVKGKKVGANQIVWKRTVEKEGTEAQQDIISAKYTAIPRSLPKKWTATTVVTRGDTTKTANVDVIASDR